MSPEVLTVLKHEVQLAALSIMIIVYAAKIIWIMKYKPIIERTKPKGNRRRAVTASFFCIAAPWSMESTSKKWYKWLEFVVFHIGIALAIYLSFYISYSPESEIMSGIMPQTLLIIFSLSFIISLIRLGRRLFSPVNRLISHPDDYFSIAMMVLWFGIGIIFLINTGNNLFMGLYLAITALLIAYVPFSKMSHYIMWPFSRYYFGKYFGHRGVYPKIRGGRKIA